LVEEFVECFSVFEEEFIAYAFEGVENGDAIGLVDAYFLCDEIII
jgi:hypothetical protein